MEEKSFANGNGDSASGASETMPLWLHGDWEYAQARASQSSSWTVQA